jgi:transposase
MFLVQSNGKKKPRPRRSFTPEFKADIVQRCRQGDRTVRQIAQDFDLTETAVRAWTKQAEVDDGTRSDGLTSDETAELRSLRAENRRLQQDVDILKRATAFFASMRPGERVPVHRCGEEEHLRGAAWRQRQALL